MALGTAFKKLGRKPRKLPLPGSKPRGVKTKIAKTLNYERIYAEIMQAISRLSTDKQALIPLAGTLPEIMVALALVWLGYVFQWQRSEDGGRLRVGGAIVDFLVFFGGQRVLIRVQGSYWHSLPERKRSDLVSAERLRAKGYRLWDAWEHDIYQAWVDGRLKNFVEHGVANAA